jgi:hypothetical protein
MAIEYKVRISEKQRKLIMRALTTTVANNRPSTEVLIGLAFIVAAIGFAMCALAVGSGDTYRVEELAGPAFHFPALQPVY